MHWLISSLVFIDVSTSVYTGTTEEILIMANGILAINGTSCGCRYTIGRYIGLAVDTVIVTLLVSIINGVESINSKLLVLLLLYHHVACPPTV